jgi:hypothetical protein
MLNFDVDSWPAAGAYLMALGMSLTVVAFFVGKMEWKKVKIKKNNSSKLKTVTA